MGQGFVVSCSKCGYRLEANLGAGFMYPQEIKETIQKMESGAYGERAREFFRENPDGTVECCRVLFRCDHCGNYKADKDLTLYKPKEGAAAPKDIIPDSDYYIEAEKFEHKCEKCGSHMSIVDTSDDFYKKVYNGEIRCPKCHAK